MAPVSEELLLVWVGIVAEGVVELIAVAVVETLAELLVVIAELELELELEFELVVVWVATVVRRLPFDVATTKPTDPGPMEPSVEAIGRVMMEEGVPQQLWPPWSLQHQVVSEHWII
jgi:hypothetical protein